MENRNYYVTLVESSRQLSKREAVIIKDTGDAIRLDQATADGDLIIEVDMWAELQIHNERSRDGNKDYPNYLIIDKNGTKYVTGSVNFWNSFMDIWADMEGESDITVKIFRRPSKNYQGKSFLSCALV